MEDLEVLKYLKKISDFYFEKKDYISSGQINRAIDIVEDYQHQKPKDETK